MRRLAWLGCLIALEAGAVKVVDPLYIRTPDTALREKPNPKARVIKTLPAGAEVLWVGPDERNTQFHKVQIDGTSAYVLQADLTPSKPAQARASPRKPTPFRASTRLSRSTRRSPRPQRLRHTPKPTS